jgi:hypothetical protein
LYASPGTIKMIKLRKMVGHVAHMREVRNLTFCMCLISLVPDASTPPHPIYLKSMLILSSHLYLGLLSGLFPSDFLTKRPFGRSRYRWEDNIKMDLKQIGCEGVDWMDLAQNRAHWRAFMNTIMCLQGRWCFLLAEQLSAYQRNSLLCGCSCLGTMTSRQSRDLPNTYWSLAGPKHVPG